MRKSTFILSLCICGLMVVSSCSKRSQRTENTVIETAVYQMTQNDTVRVLALADSCMKSLKANRLDDAVKMLYTMDSTSIKSLDEDKVKAFKRRITLFPVLDYSLEVYYLRGEKDNELKYEVKFDSAPSYTSLRFSPVCKDGQWFLTIDDMSPKRRR